MATKGRLNLGFNSGTYDSSEGKNLSLQPPLSMPLNGIPRHLVVANESTISHPQEDVTSRVFVENKSRGFQSSTGTSVALDVANGSTRSDSKSEVLSEADTETEIASVENLSATSSSLGNSSKEGSDHTDSPNQNHVPKYGGHFNTTDVQNDTTSRAGNVVDELRIGLPVNSLEETFDTLEPSAPRMGHTPFSKDISLPDHNKLLRLSPTIVQRNTRRQTSSDAFEHEPCDDEFSPTGARGCISDDTEHVNFTNVNNCGPVQYSVRRAAKEQHARRDPISASPAQYRHSGSDPNWSMGNGHNGHVNGARREPISVTPVQYRHSGTDPNWSIGNGHVNGARRDPISETPAQYRHSETDPNWSMGNGYNGHVNGARRDPIAVTPAQYRHSETDPSWSMGNGHNGHVNDAFDETSTTSREQHVPESQASEEDQSFNREESTPKRACLKVCLPIAVIIVALGLMALILALSITPEKHFTTKASVQMRVDDTFKEQMANTSSESSFYYGEKFCHNVKDAVKEDMTMQSCKVTGLRNGSIIVEFEASFQTTQRYTAQELGDLFRRSGTGHSQLTSFGLVQAFADSIKVLNLETREISSEDLGGVTTTGEFDCSEKGEYYLPLSYTFPLYCEEYQLCKEGKGTARVCEEGLEYGDSEGNTGSPCHKPSNFTYCGKKRLPDNAGTTSTTSLTTSMEATTATTSVQSTSGPVTVGTSSPAMLCANVDPRIMTNASSMYECPKIGVAFVPRGDTYPNNCATYNWCNDGRVISIGDFYCADGSSFILKEWPCETDGDEDNFCEQMQRAEWCRNNGWTEADISTASVPVAQIPTTCKGFTNDFIPVNETFPDHCAKYQQCVHGKAFPKSCPPGLHFSHIGQPCVKSDDSESYCNEREK